MRAFICDRCEAVEKKPEPGNVFDEYEEEGNTNFPVKWQVMRLPDPTSYHILLKNILLCGRCMDELKIFGKPVPKTE